MKSRPATHRCLVVAGTQEHAEILREDAAEVLSLMGLRLSADKILITHVALLTELTTEFQQAVGGVMGVTASLPA